jgi:hypothetical protein
VRSVRRCADKVVVIDDGSVDSTAEMAAWARARVVRQPVSSGTIAALVPCHCRPGSGDKPANGVG